jgi:hypothetical protein
MAVLTADKKFPVLCEITRAQHFAWREAVRDACPGVLPTDVVIEMWKRTGRDTARAYLKRLDRSRPLAPQVAASIAWSSDCMGETARVEPGKDENEAYVRHVDCPWVHWHRKLDLVHEDRPGCDAWFESTVEEINHAFGTSLRTETLETLPEGGASCLRRLWTERAES